MGQAVIGKAAVTRKKIIGVEKVEDIDQVG